MERRAFGSSGLEVSVLGLGAGQVGDGGLAEDDAARLLHAALDAGITLIDTARGYGLSEERIGRHLAGRRHEFVLSTKVGYDIPGHADWTGPAVTAGIERALRTLQTDHLDIVHLHSCDLDVLRRGEVIEALEAARAAGKIRVAAYSGENEELAWAVDSGRFGSLQTSINICDQRDIGTLLPRAAQRGMGVIAKRPVANAPWRFAERPVGDYAEEYWLRLQAMGLRPGPFEWQELALRFTAFTPGVHSCIVGTANLDHLRRNIELVGRGPLPADTVAEIRAAFKQHDDNWLGEV
ncbi:MAG TPA: aldo/keto reductase [Herpetosiphonaceae bacterium]|nr:aldo/keto reductase [Herpetosiphonaceae bacterium]